MKKILLTLMVLTSALMGFSQSAQLVLSADSLCAGDTLYANVVAPQFSLSGGTGTNTQNGVMFDLISLEGCVINDFAITIFPGTTTIEVYSKAGSHVGFESNSSAWTLVGTANNVSSGSDIELGLALGIAMTTGQIRAFYITTTQSVDLLVYGNGVAVGDLINSNTFLQLKTGVGKAYPFGATFTPRDFIGRVIHSPEVVSVEWNTGATTSSIAFAPDRSVTLQAKLNAVGSLVYNTPARAVIVNNISVEASANPYTIAAGGSSTLTGNVLLKRGVATTMEGGNSQMGAMFDVAATTTVLVTGFSVNIVPILPADIEILYKTGTHVGFEANAGAWTTLATYQQVPYGSGRYLVLNTPLEILAGQSVAFYITTTNQSFLSYTIAPQVGDVSVSAPGIQIKVGKGVAYPFGATFSPRMLNVITHYEVINPAGTTYSWVHGGSSGSVLVTPGLTTTYTLNITGQGCSVHDTVTVVVSNIGIDDYGMPELLIYPNPATDMLTIETPWDNGTIALSIFDLNGRKMPHSLLNGGNGKVNIPVTDLPAGVYILKLTQGQYENTTRVQIIR